jgi:serine/threonine protein kinase
VVEARREGLFIAYSRANADWRDRFVQHLESVVSDRTLFVDRDSIPAGANWKLAISEAVDHAKCALLLLTDEYLKKNGTARRFELPILLKAHKNGQLKLLPVLVEPCSWNTVPGLRDLQLVHWPGDGEMIAGREANRALSEADSVDRAIVEICDRISRENFSDQDADDDPTEDRSITQGFTDDERADIPQQLRSMFSDRGRFTLESEEPIHTGEFALVYGAHLDDEHVAIKVVPTTALRKRVRRTLEVAEEARQKLRDTSFVHVQKVVGNSEIEAVVMEYAEWPTLHDKLEEHQGRLDAVTVAALLARVSRAQSEAHKRGVPLGALSPLSIFVDNDGEVRLSPFRIEAHLARGLTLGNDQVVSRDVLEMLTPEIYEGRLPTARQELDAHGQYYLGLLGLELLLGRRPVSISCLQDLGAKEAFFHDPRGHFEPDGSPRWVEESPALAFLLGKMLARRPADRMESAEVASDELRLVSKGRLPDDLRRCIEADYTTMMASGSSFTERFYMRLFTIRPSLRAMFGRSGSLQATHLARAIRDLVEFRENDLAARFFEHVQSHIGMGITRNDADAFRQAFVTEIIATCSLSHSSVSPQMHGDAWNAALTLGVRTMLDHLDDAAHERAS